MTPRKRYDSGDDDNPRDWRAGPNGGQASNSPDDVDAPFDGESEAEGRRRGQGPDASPDDYDEDDLDQSLAEHTGEHSSKDTHRELQDRLGDAYEVIFEAEGFQIRRLGDRAFIAEYIPDKQIVRAGPHVLFSNQKQERPEKLQKEGRERLEKGLGEWRDFGFEPAEEGHMMTNEPARDDLYGMAVPRYIQPMEKKVDSIDDVADAIQWVRSHRRFD